MTIRTPKNWIGDEGRRNREHAALFAGLITRAYGTTFELFVGHHVAFKARHQNLTTENEIPSADTLIFDHEIMKEVFGDKYLGVLVQLAQVPCGQREELLSKLMLEVAGEVKELCPFALMAQGDSPRAFPTEDWGQVDRMANESPGTMEI
jgi:hypothetical protein